MDKPLIPLQIIRDIESPENPAAMDETTKRLREICRRNFLLMKSPSLAQIGVETAMVRRAAVIIQV